MQNFYDKMNSDDVRIQHYQNDTFDNALNDDIITALSISPDDLSASDFLSDIEGYSYKGISDFIDFLIGTVVLYRLSGYINSILLFYIFRNTVVLYKRGYEKEINY